MSQPLPSLTPEMLRHAFAVLVEDPTMPNHIPAVEISFMVDGVEVHVTARDLDFIHAWDASRFGRHSECPICRSEVAA